MKKTIAITLILCLFLTVAAFAADKDNEKGETAGNLAARFYPTTTTSNGSSWSHSNIWLEGNLFLGKYDKGYKWKGTVEWLGAAKTKNFTINNVNTPVRFRQSLFNGRIGYDVWESTYVSLSYKNYNNSFDINNIGLGSGTWKGWGIGVDKKWDVSKQWDIHTNVHYFPQMNGPNNWDYRTWSYEVGGVYKWPKAVNIDFGYRGDSGSGFNNANNTSYSISGPYIGISKDF